MPGLRRLQVVIGLGDTAGCVSEPPCGLNGGSTMPVAGENRLSQCARHPSTLVAALRSRRQIRSACRWPSGNPDEPAPGGSGRTESISAAGRSAPQSRTPGDERQVGEGNPPLWEPCVGEPKGASLIVICLDRARPPGPRNSGHVLVRAEQGRVGCPLRVAGDDREQASSLQHRWPQVSRFTKLHPPSSTGSHT